jgi:hypothetical protein
MRSETLRAAKEGGGFGVIAGLMFALLQMAVAVLRGASADMPLRMFASVMLGEGAMSAYPLAVIVVAGGVAHVSLSALLGVAYGLGTCQLPRHIQKSFSEQLGLGLLFGAAVWLVNFGLLARALYPWLMHRPQWPQLLLHALGFGLPLALMITGAERRCEAEPLERTSIVA